MFCALLQTLGAGLTPLINGNCRSGRIGGLNAMLLAAESVSNIPVIGSCLAGHILATLDVLSLHLLSTTNVGAHRGPCGSATDSGDIVAASATDLVTKDAADDCADNRSRDVDLASLLDWLLLDPASLLGSRDNCPY